MSKKTSHIWELRFLFIVLISFPSICNSQCFYHKNYHYDNSTTEFGIFGAKVNEKRILFGDIAFRDSVALNTIVLFEIDDCGAIITKKAFRDSTNFSFEDIINIQGQSIVLVQVRDNMENGSDTYLYDFEDDSLTLTSIVNLDQGQNEKSLKLLSRGNSVFIMGHIDDPSARTTDIYITTYDISTKIHSTIFFQYGNYMQPKSFDFDSDSNFIITGLDRMNGQYGSFILKVDKNLNELWRRSYFRSGRNDSRDFFQMNDSIYVLAGNYEISANTLKPFFVFVNRNGTFVKDTVLNINPGTGEILEHITKTNDGLIATGTYYNSLDTNYSIQTSVYKMTYSLDTIWYKTYSIFDSPADQYPVHLTIDNDENIYVTGYIVTLDTLRNEAFQIKLNINGCLENCAVGYNNKSQEKVFKAYPNPSSSNLNVSGGEFSNLIIYNLNGQVIHQQQENSEVNVSEWKSGMYFIVITDLEGERHSLKFSVQH